jgi:UDP-glucuronate 4-epimerase
MSNQKPILVTGAAGFIGMHLSLHLLSQGHRVVGLDNLNSYYDPRLKDARLAKLRLSSEFEFVKGDVSDPVLLKELFAKHGFEDVVHLAAQAGVRYSLQDPASYTKSNLVGTAEVLEACRQAKVRHLLYASSSSVYGGNSKVPFSEDDRVDSPVSYYAATKRANELMAHTYSHLYELPTTGLRFFTVYGPYGRPDMAYWSFSEAMLTGKPIQIYGDGLLSRDFTYCDDIVKAISRLISLPATTACPARILNVGNSNPHTVNELVEALESATGTRAIREMRPMPPGDVEKTFADSSRLEALTGFRPSTPLKVGLKAFVDWYRVYRSSSN